MKKALAQYVNITIPSSRHDSFKDEWRIKDKNKLSDRLFADRRSTDGFKFNKLILDI